MRQFVYDVCCTRCQVLFYLWRVKLPYKYSKLQKFYVTGCSSDLIEANQNLSHKISFMIQRENFRQVRKLSKSVLHMRHVVTGINQWTFGVARYNAFNAIRAVIGDT